jgi:hypothetical protein
MKSQLGSGRFVGPQCFAAAVLFAVGFLFAQAQLSAQGPSDLNEGTLLELDEANGIYRFKWWGRLGNHYFIQHSEDLMTWTYLPVILPGADAIEEWGFSTGPEKFFVRLRIWTGPVTDPQTDDFDGDGIGNGQGRGSGRRSRHLPQHSTEATPTRVAVSRPLAGRWSAR